MSRKNLYYSIFFVALALGFYFIITAVVPGLGKKRIKPISYVRPFSFTNQDGNIVTQKDMAGKVYVAEFFFTTCPGICPDMNNHMRMVYEEFKDENDFRILAHTSDPDNDTPAQLKYYADSMKVNTAKWIFLTGRKDSLYKTARISYTLDDPANNLKSIDDQFIHTQFWALVDKNGNVTKIYDALKESEVKRMIKDIRKLLKKKYEPSAA
jgi:protein SCO1